MSPEYNPNDYHAVIARIDANLLSITEKLSTIQASVNTNVIQVEKRLTLLEQFKWKLIGISTGITTAFAALAQHFTNK